MNLYLGDRRHTGRTCEHIGAFWLCSRCIHETVIERAQ